MTAEVGVCDCCRLVDGDVRLKPVERCGPCSAWLCDRCRWDLARRTVAFLERRKGDD